MMLSDATNPKWLTTRGEQVRNFRDSGRIDQAPPSPVQILLREHVP